MGINQMVSFSIFQSSAIEAIEIAIEHVLGQLLERDFTIWEKKEVNLFFQHSMAGAKERCYYTVSYKEKTVGTFAIRNAGSGCNITFLPLGASSN